MLISLHPLNTQPTTFGVSQRVRGFLLWGFFFPVERRLKSKMVLWEGSHALESALAISFIWALLPASWSLLTAS